jgi:hypothetical protein
LYFSVSPAKALESFYWAFILVIICCCIIAFPKEGNPPFFAPRGFKKLPFYAEPEILSRVSKSFISSKAL